MCGIWGFLVREGGLTLELVTFCAGPNAEGLYAVMSCEIGGGNGLEPLAIGARMGLPVVDADFMGRAFPELQVSTSQAAHSSNRQCLLCPISVRIVGIQLS